jgi:uncharacterized protein (DUF736 family)
MSPGHYDNNMTGVLFKNEKEGNDKRPDYRGHCEIQGFEYVISAWINESSNGAKYMKLKFEPKRSNQADARVPRRLPPSQPQRATVPDIDNDFDDAIPF